MGNVMKSLVAAAMGTSILVATSATALEVTGRIFAIDLEADRITLHNGQVFELDGSDSGLSVGESACITISYHIVKGRNMIDAITELPAGFLPTATIDTDGACAEPHQISNDPLSTKITPRRWRFRARPLSGEARGQVIKPLPE